MTSANSLYKEIIIPPFLNPKSIGDLLKQITQLENDNIRFIILKGSDAVFCKGYDFAEGLQRMYVDQEELGL